MKTEAQKNREIRHMHAFYLVKEKDFTPEEALKEVAIMHIIGMKYFA